MTKQSTPAAAAALARVRDARRSAREGNPWLALALSRARTYSEGPVERDYEVRATRAEYAAHDDDARPCRCGGRLWYRVTVGAYQCPACRALQNHAGDYLGEPQPVA